MQETQACRIQTFRSNWPADSITVCLRKLPRAASASCWHD